VLDAIEEMSRILHSDIEEGMRGHCCPSLQTTSRARLSHCVSSGIAKRNNQEKTAGEPGHSGGDSKSCQVRAFLEAPPSN
jgi:hypothetical protein